MEPRLPPLSPRLAAVAHAIARGSRVADVGAGHGKLPLWLLASERAAFCLATEKSEPLLARVARPASDARWADRLGYRAGDGLAVLDPEDRIDTVVLAGLGGRSIVRILEAPESLGLRLKRLVLQPRSELMQVRAWLSDHGWRLVSEQISIERGRFHVTVAVERGDDADLYSDPRLSREDLLAAGPLLSRSRSLAVRRFWRVERDRYATILSRFHPQPGPASAREGFARMERLVGSISTRGG
jgi:tRNA (adenine22-N1)-methyltransferase